MKLCMIINGKQTCIEIPIYVHLPKWGELPPNPRFSLIDQAPKPEPPGHEVMAQDLRVLATLEAVSTRLSPALQKTFKDQIQKAVNKVELPQGVTINF